MEKLKRMNRIFECEVRADQDEEKGAYITGQPIVFGETYSTRLFDETIEPGALDNADLKDVRLLVNHDLTMIPLARSRNNNSNSTMQLERVGGGLNIRANLDIENNPTAAELYSAVQRGDISGMSFCFTVKAGGENWTGLETDHPVRHIRAIDKVFEVSAVTMPAYEATSIEARSADEQALESARAALESAKAEEQARRTSRVEALSNRRNEVKGH